MQKGEHMTIKKHSEFAGYVETHKRTMTLTDTSFPTCSAPICLIGTGLALLSGLKTTSKRRRSSGGMSEPSAGCKISETSQRTAPHRTKSAMVYGLTESSGLQQTRRIVP